MKGVKSFLKSLRAEHIKTTWMDAPGVRRCQFSVPSAHALCKHYPYFGFLF